MGGGGIYIPEDDWGVGLSVVFCNSDVLVEGRISIVCKVNTC